MFVLLLLLSLLSFIIFFLILPSGFIYLFSIRQENDLLSKTLKMLKKAEKQLEIKVK